MDDATFAHRVQGCWLYPVKGCAGMPVERLDFDEHGWLIGDRDWLIVDAQQQLCWLGGLPALGRLQAVRRAGPSGPQLGLQHGLDWHALPAPADTTPCHFEHWNPESSRMVTQVAGDAGDTWAARLSAWLGTPLRLLYAPSRQHRPRAAHLVCEASLIELAQALPDLDLPSLLARLRPNLLISASASRSEPQGPAPWPGLEMQGHALRTPASPTLISIEAPCERCIGVDANPAQARIDSHVLPAIATWSAQQGVATAVHFGLYIRPHASLSLPLGAPLDLLVKV